MRRIPNGGIGYGLLRYLTANAEIRAELDSLPQAAVSFNYRGYLQTGDSYSLFRPTHESLGPQRSQLGIRYYLLDITGSVWQRKLRVAWRYSHNIHHASTIQAVAETTIGVLRTLIDESPQESSNPDARKRAQKPTAMFPEHF